MDIKKKSPFILNLLIFLTFDLMLLGAGVRTMDAGLTCPDWPMCFGKAVPEFHFGVYLEFIHRVIAGFLAIVYMIFFVRVWRKPELQKVKVLSLIGLFFLLAQIVMGGLTVLKLLEAYIVTLHLSLATIFLFTLYLMKQKLSGESKVRINRNKLGFAFKALVGIGVISVLGQIVLGGMVASTYSGLVCIDFPTCNGQYFPEMRGPIAIQMFHRFGAYWLATLMVTIFLMSIFYWKKIGLDQRHRRQAVTIFLVVFTQIFVGVMNLKFLMPALLSVFHLGLALSILLMLLSLITTLA